MVLETDRLFITPLTVDQLKLWIEDIVSLEKDLNCTYFAEPMEGIFLDVVKGQYEKIKKDAENYLYYSFWFVIRKEDRVVVGSGVFQDSPNENNEIEIGYGLGKEFEHNGYMTEAVQAMCDWAMEQDNISHVIAETDIYSPQSQNILKRCGFVQYKQDKSIWWRL